MHEVKLKLELKSQAQFNHKQFKAIENAELSFMKIIYEKIIILCSSAVFISVSYKIKINRLKSISISIIWNEIFMKYECGGVELTALTKINFWLFFSVDTENKQFCAMNI